MTEGAPGPEAAFVLALARDEAMPAWERVDLHASGVVHLAAAHEVDALCSWNLRTGDAPIPGSGAAPTIDAAFRRAYLHHRLRNEALLQDVDRVEAELVGQRIDHLYLKGPWLAWAAYPDPGTRPVGDLDLCLHEQDYPAAVRVLERLGYRPRSRLPPYAEAALHQAHYGEQLRFWARGHRPIELHFRLVNVGPPSRDEAWVWTSARQLRLPSGTIAVPGLDAMLVHLVLHANQHGFAVLRLLHDVRWALASDRGATGHDLFLDRVHRLRCPAAAFHGLELAQDLAGAKVPPGILEELRPSFVRRKIYRRCWQLESVRGLAHRQRSNRFEAPRLYLLEMGGTTEKVHYVLEIMRHAGGVRQAARRLLPRRRSTRRA